MWEILFKQLGIKPEEIKQQAMEAHALVINFDNKLNKIIALLEKQNEKPFSTNIPQISYQPLSNGENHD